MPPPGSGVRPTRRSLNRRSARGPPHRSTPPGRHTRQRLPGRLRTQRADDRPGGRSRGPPGGRVPRAAGRSSVARIHATGSTQAWARFRTAVVGPAVPLGQPSCEPPRVGSLHGRAGRPGPVAAAARTRYAASAAPMTRIARVDTFGIGAARNGAAASAMASPTRPARLSRAEIASTAPPLTPRATPARIGFTPNGSRYRRRELGVLRDREETELVERPVAEPRPPYDVRDLDGAEVPGVRRILPMIAHDEQFTIWDDPPGCATRGRVGLLLDTICRPEDVRLIDLRAVHEDQAVLELERIAGEAGDPLDARDIRALAPARRWLEDDDVAIGIRIPTRGQLVHQHVLLRDERVLHGALLDLVRLGDEGLDPEEDDDRQDEGLKDLEQAAERGAWAPRTGGIGAVRLSRPVIA